MILDDIVEYTKERVRKNKEQKSFDTIKEEAVSREVSKEYPFEEALRKSQMSFICEVKKASPSKGVIADEFDYLSIAKEYEKIGADAISVLTEPKFFMGSNKYLEEIREAVNIPILRKDFVIDEYQIYEAKLMGADAILLICAILDERQLKEYLNLAHTLGLSALVETHNEAEVYKAINAGARIIGVNNRDLTTFNVDTDTTAKLSNIIPDDVIFVSESGIKCAADIEKVRAVGADAVLIGEAFMRSENKGEMIKGLRL